MGGSIKKVEATSEDILNLARLHLKDKLPLSRMATEMGRSLMWCTKTLQEVGLYVGADGSDEERDRKWNHGNPLITVPAPFFKPGVEYVAVCKATGKEFDDFRNASGALTAHLRKLRVPMADQSDFKKKKFQTEQGRPWFVDHFEFIQPQPKEARTYQYQPRAEITEAQFTVIKKGYLEDGLSMRALEEAVGMSSSLIHRVLLEWNMFVPFPPLEDWPNKHERLEEYKRLRSEKAKQNIRFDKKGMPSFFEEGKNYVAICRQTGERFPDYLNASGIITRHLERIMPDMEHETNTKKREFFKTTGKPWYYEHFDFNEVDNVVQEKRKCAYCDWTTNDLSNASGWYTTHIVSVHNLTVEEHVKIHEEESLLFKTELERIEQKKANAIDMQVNPQNWVECGVCGEKLRAITQTHLAVHGMDHTMYKEKYGAKGIFNSTTSKKMSDTAILYNKTKQTYKENKLERAFREATCELQGIRKQKSVGKFMFDWCLEDRKILIELDGDYWHGYVSKGGYHFKQILNFVRDVKKDEVAKESGYRLYRIREKDVKQHAPQKFNSENDLITFLDRYEINLQDHPLLRLKEHDIIFSKEYCERGRDEMLKNEDLVDTLLEFWTTFYPPEKYIKDCIDLSKRPTTVSWLKGVFADSYYRSHKREKGLFDIFQDKGVLREVVKYRLGLNKKKELFDVSIMQLYRGIAVRTVYNVGVFPIEQARGVYQNNVQYDDVVYDPYAGWGSRMLACCERGAHYVGNDINLHLKDGYERIIKEKDLKNCTVTFGDSKVYQESLKGRVDFIFTSPPFYYDELYSYSETPKGLDTQTWFAKELLPVLVNCHAYLKTSGKMVLDMNEKYVVELSHCLLNAGFTIVSTEYYGVKKSHYMRSGGQEKRQALITCNKQTSNQ